MGVDSEFRDHVKNVSEFLSVSTIAGVKNVSRKGSTSNKWYWSILIALSLIGCILLCKKGYLVYISYDVRTSITYGVSIGKNDDLQMFLIPNLVFCHPKTIKRSIFNTDAMAREYYFRLVSAYMPANENVTHWRKEFARLCPPSPKDDQLPLIDFAGLSNNTNLYERLIDLACQAMTTRRDVLLKCLWKGAEIACNAPSKPEMVTDVYTDDTLCFRFQYDPTLVQNIADNSGKSVSAAKHHDLTLFFDTKQSQRCGHPVLYAGEGFSISTGDKLSLFDTDTLSKRFSLHAGLEYVAKISTLKTVRNTEHLGRCRSRGYHANNNSMIVLNYTKAQCQSLAWLRSLYQKCQCMPPVPEFLHPILTRENVGMVINLENLCSNSLTSLRCLLESVVSESIAAFISKDSMCLEACVETNSVTSFLIRRKLTTDYVLSFNANVLDIAAKTDYPTLKKWIERNAVILHVDFDTRKIDIMIENQVFTFIDLLRYLASACSLFFGMSCISFFEAAYVLLRVIFHCLKRK